MTAQLQSILEAEGLSSLLGKFNEQGVTDSILGDLTDSDLKDIGIDKLGERKRLLALFASGLGSSGSKQPESCSGLSADEPTIKVASPLAHVETSRKMIKIPSGVYVSEELGFAEVPVQEFLMSEFRVVFDEWKEIYEWAIDNGFAFRSAEDFENELLQTMQLEYPVFEEGELQGLRAIYKAKLVDERSRGESESDAKTAAYRHILLEKGCGRPEGVLGSVIKVNWFDVIVWCNAKSAKEGLRPAYFSGGSKSSPSYTTHYAGGMIHHPIAYDTSADGYRLPTVVEWVYVAAEGVPDKGSNPNLGPNLLGVYGMPVCKPSFEDLYEDPEGIEDWLWDSSAQRETLGREYRQTSRQRGSGLHAMNMLYKNGFHTARNSPGTMNSKSKGGLFGFMKSANSKLLFD
jgi:Sulfatase-modifying factor enzyme 1/SAM domain (Sterile alpha motif)